MRQESSVISNSSFGDHVTPYVFTGIKVYLNYAGKPVSGGSFTWAKEHIVILGSLSKTYSMTGWRAGYALAAKPVAAIPSASPSR